jgi:hypothetical protein
MLDKFIFLFLLVSIIACNGGGGGGRGSSDGNGEGIGESEEEESLTNLIHFGVWTACEDIDKNEDNINDSSVLHVLAIDASALGYFRTIYSDTSCVVGNEQYKFNSISSYTRSEDTYTLFLKSETYQSLSEIDVLWNNLNSWCELTNWQLNVPQNILGKTCEGEFSEAGDVSYSFIARSEDVLMVDGLLYDIAISGDLTPRGETLQNGTYAFSDGEYTAIMGVFNNGNYTVYYYNILSREYTIESGTYSSSNNVVTFTVSSSNPVGCATGRTSRRFSNGSLALTLELAESDVILYAMKVTYTEAQFRNEFLGGGFTVGCVL